MARAAKKTQVKSLEQRLWDMADALRGNQEPSEYKHVVLGLVFLKYISDRFEARRLELATELAEEGIPEARREEFLEDRDEYASQNVFWVPAEARYGAIQARAKLRASAPTSTRRWTLSRRRTHRSAASYPATTAARAWTRAGWVSSWT